MNSDLLSDTKVREVSRLRQTVFKMNLNHFIFNSILFIYSFDVFETRNIYRNVFAYYLMRGFNIFAILYSNYTSFRILTSSTGNALVKISNFLNSFITLVLYIEFVIKFKTLLKLFRQIDQKIREQQKERVKRLSLTLSMTWIVAVTINFAVLTLKQDQIHRFVPIVITENLLKSIFGFGWIAATVLVYICVCHRIHLLEESLISDQRYDHNINHLFVGRYHLLDFQQRIKFLITLKEVVNNEMGILPFLWFCQSFQKTCLELTFIAVFEKSNLFNSFVKSNLEFLIFYSMFIFSIDYIHSQRPGVKQLLNMLNNCTYSVSTLTTNPTIFLSINILITDYNKTCYQIWNIYSIDKSFLSDYLNSVITFTVILTQIINQLHN